MKSLIATLILLTSSYTFAGVPIESRVGWSKKSIKVCFGNNDHRNYTFAIYDKAEFIEYTKKQKEWIKQIITQEYKISEVGIEFTGWEDCNSKASNADVVILRAEPNVVEILDDSGLTNERGGRATLGERGNASTSINALTNIETHSYEKSTLDYLNYVIINTRVGGEKRIGAENFIKLTALHEFGHTAGLRHAHLKLKEAQADENCKRTSTLKLSQEDTYVSTIFTGPFDNNSVMNYCYFNLLVENGLSFKEKSLSGTPMVLTDPSLYTTKATDPAWLSKKPRVQIDVRIGFSAMDKHALKCLYVFDEATKKERCNYPQ